MRHVPLTYLLLVCLVSLLGCRDKPGAPTAGESPTVRLGRVEVTWVDLVDSMSVERNPAMEKRLEDVVENVVAERDGVSIGTPGQPPLELSVVSGDVSTDEVAPDAGIDVEVPESIPLLTYTLKTTWSDGWKISSSVMTSVNEDDLESEDCGSTEIVEDLLEDLVAQIDLFDMSVADLVAFIDNRDCIRDDVCATAVRILGERGDSSAVPALASLLDETGGDDPIVADLIGALGRLGDHRASPALVAAFNRVDGVLQVAIIDALASTGGEEARLFLEVVASGHESAMIREQASRALARVE